MTDDRHRRSTDALVFEMHGVVCELKTLLSTHMKWEEGEHVEIRAKTTSMEDRISKLEETKRSMRPLWVVFITTAMAFLTAAGVWLWERILRMVPHLAASRS